jgi:hypothetical protein
VADQRHKNWGDHLIAAQLIVSQPTDVGVSNVYGVYLNIVKL